MLTERGDSDHMDRYLPSWLKRANFVRVRDLRDPAASAAMARAARNGAVYRATRCYLKPPSRGRLRTHPNHSPIMLPWGRSVEEELAHAPIQPARCGCITTCRLLGNLTRKNKGKGAGVTSCGAVRATLRITKLLPQKLWGFQRDFPESPFGGVKGRRPLRIPLRPKRP